ncbi:hypothetical protein [Staphylococcus durrellii]|uniref:hypothetical protein n=1 Tax=Staphylococcus durrellii TaxID=2781773 RepID=UPI0018A10854|nr:hypothetical protein [Staphylococcus durrellii]MBF7018261.1 hypothetical protein [Staphylococcus durrellii]
MKKNNKNKQKKNPISKILGVTFLIIALGIIAMYMINMSNKETKEQNETLQQSNSQLKKSNKSKQEIIERLDEDNVKKEEKEVRKQGKDFIDTLYISDPKTNDKKRYEEAKKVMTSELANKYFGDKRKTPIKYKTDIQDVNIYNDEYSPAKKEYKMFATLKQVIQDPDGTLNSQRDLVSEIDLVQTKDGWKVKKFKQIGEEEIKDGGRE